MASTASLPGTVVLITGANQGIGLALARIYAQRPNHTVVGTVRDPASASELAKAGAKVVQLDVASDESVAGLPQRLAEIGVDRVNVLFNNAGVLKNQHALGSPGVTQEALEQFNTNALGPLRVTGALLPLLRKAASASLVKVANISSRMGSVEDNTSGGYYGYRASKAAENIISVSMARDLAKDNIVSLVLHPGYVSTRMVGHKGQISPEESAGHLSKVVDNANSLEAAYKFHSWDGSIIPW